MNKRILLISIITILSNLTVYSNSKSNKHWDFIPIPTISYTTDLGLQLGGLCDIYHYGNDNNGLYKEKIYLDFGWATKGSGYVHGYVDVPDIWKNIRATASATYKISSLYPFYGFNGMYSPYNPVMDLNSNTKTAFYSTGLNMLRLMLTFRGNIYENLKWVSGINYWHFKVTDIKSKSFNTLNTLKNEYIKAGIISADEMNGGGHLEFREGISYDTRDNDADTHRGIWAEAYLYGSPDFSGKGYNYLKSAIHFRQYIPFFRGKITFAYHLAWQQKLLGNCPFYMQQEIAAIELKQPETDGLGGRNTIRGVLLGRLIGDGYAWGNFELRCRLFSFNLIKRHWEIVTNPFIDAGIITKPYRLDKMMKSGNPVIYSGKQDKPHISIGAGLKLIMDKKFVLSAEIARPRLRQDGEYGINIGVNYIF